MNMLQRNPRDSKHREFHDGEYEYWPAKAPTAGKSISFPAALLNGLGMLASVAAAALLAAALTVLYTQSSPRYISENDALINVNIYNNVENLDIRYTLIRELDPDTILKQGPLDHSTQTLTLQNLTPGTKYVLLYDSFSDGEWESIGDFPFLTPGDTPEDSVPTEASENAASEPENTDPTEDTAETTVPVETVEETTEN